MKPPAPIRWKLAGPNSASAKKQSAQLQKIVAKILYQQKAAVSAQLRTQLESGNQTPNQIASGIDLSGFDDFIEPVGDALADAALTAAAESLEPISAYLVTGIFDQVNDGAVAYARQRAAEMVGKRLTSDGNLVDNPNPEYAITDSTRDLIQRVIAQGLEDNIGNQAIIEKIEELGFGESRAELIAFTEIGNANSETALQSLQGAEDSGMDVTKAWSTAQDDLVDEEICQLNEEDGDIPIDQPFSSGDMRPLGHPRCRCSLTGSAE